MDVPPILALKTSKTYHSPSSSVPWSRQPCSGLGVSSCVDQSGCRILVVTDHPQRHGLFYCSQAHGLTP